MMFDNILNSYVDQEDVAENDNYRLEDAVDSVEVGMDAIAEDFKPVNSKADFKDFDYKELDYSLDEIQAALEDDDMKLAEPKLEDAFDDIYDDAHNKDAHYYNQDLKTIKSYNNWYVNKVVDWNYLLEDNL